MMDNNIIQICRLTLDEIEELHKIIKEKDKKIQALTDELEMMRFGVSFGSNTGLSSLGTSVSTTKNTSQSSDLDGETKYSHTSFPDSSTQNTEQWYTSRLSEGVVTSSSSHDSN